MAINHKSANKKSVTRVVVLAAAIMSVFFGAYAYASGRSTQTGPGAAQVALEPGTTGASTTGGAGSSGGFGCACCGSTAPTKNGLTGDKKVGAAKVEGAVQRISVDLSKGYYDPNVIQLKAGVPAEITFGQGSSCAAQIYSDKLGFNVDTSSGPQTVKLPALEPGEYSYSCTMQMVFGKIVVK